jgi:hypothetical protein
MRIITVYDEATGESEEFQKALTYPFVVMNEKTVKKFPQIISIKFPNDTPSPV